eukprot:CAMPEP_0180299442 /NCGR_PEP_ID=MMETSP0988-20121125/22126_1 /TAXON_ID=697907 /ORGANISM="non described non described, Strain CCMP2293" /LENGTH=130 /DNA_ID=CAMNT_0022279271 /DNA_START=241 /DNA_END=631 /DNA_ORIENTATION=-
MYLSHTTSEECGARTDTGTSLFLRERASLPFATPDKGMECVVAATDSVFAGTDLVLAGTDRDCGNAPLNEPMRGGCVGVSLAPVVRRMLEFSRVKYDSRLCIFGLGTPNPLEPFGAGVPNPTLEDRAAPD